MLEEKLKLETVIKEYKKIFEETKKDINLVETNNRGEEDLDFEIIENLIITFENKLKYLNNGMKKPYFARIDFEDSEDKDICYIGKVGVMNKDNEIITVDWRAPISTLYYDSNIGETSYLSPQGIVNGTLKLKRQYDIEDGILNSYNDVDTVVEDELLKPYLNVSSDSRLKNIVASIQGEQNRIIRESAYKNIIVQGVAGSGKTTVALHRVAYLVYNNKLLINPDQYMVIGPNKFFINYISSVLPDLDVNGVKQFDFIELSKDYIEEKFNVIDTIDNQSTYYKTSYLYKEALDKYIDYLDSIVIPNNNLYVFGFKIMDENNIKKIYDGINKNYSIFEKIEKCIMLVEKEIKDNAYNLINKSNDYINDLFDKEKDILKKKEIIKKREIIKKEILNNAHSSVRKYFNIYNNSIISLYSNFLENINNYIKEEVILNYLKIDYKKIKKNIVEYEDLAALMYLKYKISGSKKYDKYKHIVVDESQDYNEFIFYTFKKIMKNSTFSIFGDLAQSIYPYRSINDWNTIKKLDDFKILYLSKSYRTSIEIMNEANKINEYLKLPIAEPVIRHGNNPKYINNMDYEFILEKVKTLNTKNNTIAIISKNEIDAKNIYKYLKDYIKINLIETNDNFYNGGICSITSTLAKGLEFDAVIINGIDEEYFDSKVDTDMKLLYVSMTRPLHELILLYKNDITSPLR